MLYSHNNRRVILKKSYMDRKSILNEGFFDKIRKVFGLSTKQEKLLRQDKKIIKLIKNLNNDVDEFEKYTQDMFKDLGINKKVSITKYQLKDFI